MKNKYFILMFAVLLISIVCSQGISARSSDLDISLKYSPKPIFSGSYANLTFKIENTGNQNLTNLTFDLDANDPISLLSNNQQSVSFIEPDGIYYITYPVYIDANADEGTETVTLKYKIDGSSYDDDYDIDISAKNVYLMIESVKAQPSEVEPGRSMILSITLENTANSEIKDIDLKLLTNTSPFSLQGVGERHISSLSARSSTTINFNLTANANAVIQTYQIPLTLSYIDVSGNLYQRQDYVYVKVYAQPDIEIVIDSNSLIIGRSSTVTLKVLNKGLSDVKFAQVNILNSQDYSIDSINSNYIGTINSDDYTTIDFKITPNKQNISLNVILSYSDLDNKEYSNQINLNAKAYTVQEAQKNGLLPKSSLVVFVVIIVIVVIIILVSLRKKRKKQNIES